MKDWRSWCGVSIGLAITWLLTAESLSARVLGQDAETLSDLPQKSQLKSDTPLQPQKQQAQNVPSIPPIQTDPEPDPSGRFGSPEPDAEPLEPEDEPLPEEPTPPQPQSESDPDAPQFFVERVEVVGSSIFTAEELATFTAAVEGRAVTLQELQEVADAITQEYLDRDYITSRAIVPNQDIQDGVVTLQIIEGRLGEIRIEGTERLHESFVRSRIDLAADVPLDTAALEDQLRLLRADPLFETVEASLRAGDEIGESLLVVRVSEANPFGFRIATDNYSPPSVGGERGILGIRHRNLAGFGDEIDVEYNFSYTNGLDFFDIAYRVPVNPMEGTLQFRVSPNRNEITQAPFDEFDIRGQSTLYEVDFRQPLIRTPREEFALSLGFSWQDSQTFLDDNPEPFGIGPDEDGRSRTRSLRFSQDYVRRDVNGAWVLRSQMRFGTRMFGATLNAGDDPDGQFFSWLGQFQRIQRLGDDHLLIARLFAQFSPDPLLPSQQFVIGGGQSLRGYRQNVRAGDNGFSFSVEDRITLLRDASGLPKLQVLPFLDMGAVWNHDDNPNAQADQRFLVGLGVGAIWEAFPGFVLRVDYGVPLVDLDDRGDNIQDDGFYFSVGYEL
ncbi:ShlB/FhaC/HecB family hemolysin secretion/activation protein [Baaleninema sp.]|uniref:ShlB/FhaC/HecB family hemolysin secretion/activation protein n=1 Tax=Baaleninema sp. TaxID=3101197 RepID=UPI003D028AAC